MIKHMIRAFASGVMLVGVLGSLIDPQAKVGLYLIGFSALALLMARD